MEFKTEVNEFLREHKDGSLATTLDNIPRSSPVQYFVGNDLDLYVLSAGGEKFASIEQNPNVCLLVNSDYLNYRQIKGVQIFGTATTSLMDDKLFEEASTYYPDKYIMDHEKNRLKVIKIKPQEMVYLDSLIDGDRTKQVFKNNNVYTKDNN
jgi:nitroimidazol reductase NimA-like FMN-containing flavoprotein (pyridoxamine 5'-phosphate oxidase superfamily)